MTSIHVHSTGKCRISSVRLGLSATLTETWKTGNYFGLSDTNNRRMRTIARTFISLNIIMVMKRVKWNLYLALGWGGGGAYTIAEFVI